MNKIDNNTFLKYLIIIACVWAILAFLMPIISFDLSELYIDQGIENPKELYFKHESSFCFSNLHIYNNQDSAHPYEYHRLSLFYGLHTITSGENPELFLISHDYYINDIQDWSLLSFSNIRMIALCFGLIFSALFLFLVYKILSNLKNLNSRYLLYSGCILLIMLLGSLFIIYITWDMSDNLNLGYSNYLHFDYGFYLIIASIVLFFTASIIDKYFNKFLKENSDN